MTGQAPERIHASCVAFDGRGVLLIGPSGAGKSSLALRLMSLGARLVSDDQTLLEVEDGKLFARAPDNLCGMIEARYLGLLSAPAIDRAPIVLVVDLSRNETERLPPMREIVLAGIECALAYGSDPSHLSHAVRCMVLHGRCA